MRLDLYSGERERFLNFDLEDYNYTYKLYNCINSDIVYTNSAECPSCFYNIGNIIRTDLSPATCWYVSTTNSTPEPITTVMLQEGPCDECIPKCYTITGTGNVTYVNASYELITTETAPIKICSITYPSVTGTNHQIFVGEECTYREGCNSACYELTNCETEEVIYSDNQDLAFPYALNEIVKLDEFDGCWTIDVFIGESCPPPVNTTVTESYASCLECNPPTYYKLQSCGSSEPLTVFTSQDFSSYVGKTVKLEEYPGCFNVTVFTSQFPSPVTVTITYSYSDCPECEAKRYKLTDCDNIRPSIYTTTDLTAYVGSVIKLTFYPDTCWTVEETLVNTSDDLVIVANNYSTCDACTIDATCICSTVTNNSTESATFEFRNCDNDIESITLDAGSTSTKQCVLKWIFPENWTLPKIITNYGDCVDGKCATNIKFKSIRPGYNSPACSAEYYERIACEYSEILYRDVISQRYGIAPCCPEEEIYRLDIKYQLLELQAINNPDYECTPTNTCCQKDDTCGCGCNS